MKNLYISKSVKNKDLTKNVLTKDETKKIFEQIRNGNEEVKNKFIEDNMGLVWYTISNVFASDRTVDKDDLYQEGYICLMKAVDKFNPDLGFNFSTFAITTLIRNLTKYILKNSTVQYVPYYALLAYNKIQRLMGDNNILDLNEDVITYLSKETGLTNKQVETLLKIKIIPKDLQEPFYSDDDEFWEKNLYSNELAAKSVDMIEDLIIPEFKKLALSIGIKEDDLDVFMAYNGLDDKQTRTLVDMAKERGLTRQRVHAIKDTTQKKLQRSYTIREFLSK